MLWMVFHSREGNVNWLIKPVYDPNILTAEYGLLSEDRESIDA